MEVLDKGSGLECTQKLARLGEISQEFEANRPRIDQIKEKATAVMDQVSNLETQQVEEQLKAVERRHNDVHKRIQRKAQILEMTKKGVDSALQEIEQARNWAREKMAEVENPSPLGCDSKTAEEKLQSLKVRKT
jgi:nesprin-1